MAALFDDPHGDGLARSINAATHRNWNNSRQLCAVEQLGIVSLTALEPLVEPCVLQKVGEATARATLRSEFLSAIRENSNVNPGLAMAGVAVSSWITSKRVPVVRSVLEPLGQGFEISGNAVPEPLNNPAKLAHLVEEYGSQRGVSVTGPAFYAWSLSAA